MNESMMMDERPESLDAVLGIVLDTATATSANWRIEDDTPP
jgi:hypothetical protein